jgi:hypothetical protein
MSGGVWASPYGSGCPGLAKRSVLKDQAPPIPDARHAWRMTKLLDLIRRPCL